MSIRNDINEDNILSELNELNNLLEYCIESISDGKKPRYALKESIEKITILKHLIFRNENINKENIKVIKDISKFDIIDINDEKPKEAGYYVCIFKYENNPAKLFIASKRFDLESNEFYSNNKNATIVAWFKKSVKLFNSSSSKNLKCVKE